MSQEKAELEGKNTELEEVKAEWSGSQVVKKIIEDMGIQYVDKNCVYKHMYIMNIYIFSIYIFRLQ